MKDPYEILGVPRTASDAQVKSAYRRLAKQYHPDMHPGDTITLEKFRDVCAAYETLTSAPKPQQATYNATAQSRKRKRAHFGYRKRMEEQQASSFSPNSAQPEGSNAGTDKRSTEDVFSDLFSGLKSAGKKAFSKSKTEGAYHLELEFREAALGTTKRINLPSGKQLNVKIPGGILNGQHIRLRNQPTQEVAHQDDPSLLTIHIKDHPYFTRHGANVHLELPIRVDEAVLGTKLNIPTVDGSVVFTLPPGSNAQSVFRLKAKGAKVRGKLSADNQPMRGDQYISLKIVLPDPSDQGFTKLIKRWRPSHNYQVRNHLNTEVTSE